MDIFFTIYDFFLQVAYFFSKSIVLKKTYLMDIFSQFMIFLWLFFIARIIVVYGNFDVSLCCLQFNSFWILCVFRSICLGFTFNLW